MSGNLNDRPFLLLMLKVMRMMLWCCIASLALVGGAIWYSVTKIQGRAYEAFTSSDMLLFWVIGILILISAAILFGVSRTLGQADRAAKDGTD
jgi:uncharacterized membrane protein